MSRLLSLAMVLLAASSASAADRFATPRPEPVPIATTGRILKIDLKKMTLKVRPSDGQGLSIRSVSQNFAQVIQGLRQHIGVTLPGGITIALPGRSKNPPKPAQDKADDAQEYTVVITEETVFQDGGESIQLEDFRTGEIISIHGTLDGRTVTASRIAKWF